MRFDSPVPADPDTNIIYRSECPPARFADTTPTLAYLELIPACSNRCPSCLNGSFIADFHTRALKPVFHRPSLTGDEWLSILSHLPGTLSSVILSGGEPTLHPDFATLITEISARGLEFVIFTNGRWHKPAQMLAMLGGLPLFRGFLVSLHGAAAGTHDSFTGAIGSFAETVSNIRAAAVSGLPVSLSTVITQENLTELASIVELATELGAHEISFNRYLVSPDRLDGSSKAIHPPTSFQFRQAIECIEMLREEMSSRIQIGYGPCIPQCFALSASTGCSAGQASFVVDPWGNLKPCLHTDLLCGNLNEQSFDAIWCGNRLLSWRGLVDSACTNCSAFAQCGGGCRAMALAWGQTHDPLMTAPIPVVGQEQTAQLTALSVAA